MQKSHYNKTSSLLSLAIISALALAGSNAYAAAVSPKPWISGDNVLDLGFNSITATESATKSAYSDNPNLNYSAWAHVGDWFVFQNTGLQG